MPAFADKYRILYGRFGFPLDKMHGISARILDKAADRLGVVIPAALRDYYAVAGNQRRFNRSLQRFLHPSKWSIDERHLVFLEENQSVCWWGVSLKSRGAKDPMVSQGINHEDEIEWHKEHDKCSVFISVLLHYQAVSGALGFCASGSAPDDVHKKLKQGWQYVGEANQLWAFSRQNQVVCIMAGGAPPFMPAMVLMAGGKTARDLKAIGDSLGVKLK
jgi:hypothetical protein